MNRRARLASSVALAIAASLAAPLASAQIFVELDGAFPNPPCGGSGCWTNYLRLTDIDNDDDLDVLFPNAPGLFQNEGNQIFAVYVNNGTGAFTNVSQAALGGVVGQIRQVAVGDVDHDGDVDLYAPEAFGGTDRFFINDGTGNFTDEQAQRMPAGLGSHAGAARFADVDNDGDLDLWVADGYATSSATAAHLYLNDGSGKFTDATGNLPTGQQGVDPDDFDVFDADRDWDLDLLINMHSGKSSLWFNDGTGKFTDGTDKLANMGSGLHYGPGVCDVDGDGDLDVWTDNIGPGYTEQLQINDGTGQFTDETSARVSNNPGNDDNGIVCVDYDGDGDLDAAIPALGSGAERILQNDGTGHFVYVSGLFEANGDSTLWMEFGDVNGDGRLDAVTAQGESNNLDRLYLGNSGVPIDTVPPRIIAVEPLAETIGAGATPVLRFAVSDNTVTDEGPRLSRAFARISTDDAMQEVDATFMGGDLFRAVLPAQETQGATVTALVCAIDRQGNEACSEPQTYTIMGTTSGSGVGSGGEGQGGGPSGSGAGPGGAASGSGGLQLKPGDDGCGCAVPGSAGPTGGAASALGALGALAAWSRWMRRRRARRP
jgi:hypothetical protein